jgi:hypothetical protein
MPFGGYARVRRRSVTVEVWLVVGEIRTTFNGERTAALRRSRNCVLRFARTVVAIRRSFTPAHLRALLFQNSFARETDAVAFHRQHFHEYLIAFFQFVANVRDAVFRNFANVQQSIGAGDDFDKCAEIRQAGHSAKVGLADFGRCRQITDNLQRFVRRRFIV